MRRIVSLVYETAKYHIAALSLDDRMDGESHGTDGWNIRHIRPEDIPKIKSQFGESIAMRFRKRLKDSTGFALHSEDRIIGYLWCTGNPIKKEGVKPFYVDIHPKKEVVYLYDWLTKEEYRGKGVMTALVVHALREYKRDGFMNAFYLFSARNLAMTEVTPRLGFKVCGSITYKRVLWYVVKDMASLCTYSEVH